MHREVIRPQSQTRYAREARLATEADALFLHELVWDGARERHERTRLDPSTLEAVDTAVIDEAESILALHVSERPRAVGVEDAGRIDTEASAEGERVVIEHEGGLSRVIFWRGARHHLVWQARATAMAPCLALDTEGDVGRVPPQPARGHGRGRPRQVDHAALRGPRGARARAARADARSRSRRDR